MPGNPHTKQNDVLSTESLVNPLSKFDTLGQTSIENNDSSLLEQGNVSQQHIADQLVNGLKHLDRTDNGKLTLAWLKHAKVYIKWLAVIRIIDSQVVENIHKIYISLLENVGESDTLSLWIPLLYSKTHYFIKNYINSCLQKAVHNNATSLKPDIFLQSQLLLYEIFQIHAFSYYSSAINVVKNILLKDALTVSFMLTIITHCQQKLSQYTLSLIKTNFFLEQLLDINPQSLKKEVSVIIKAEIEPERKIIALKKLIAQHNNEPLIALFISFHGLLLSVIGKAGKTAITQMLTLTFEYCHEDIINYGDYLKAYFISQCKKANTPICTYFALYVPSQNSHNKSNIGTALLLEYTRALYEHFHLTPKKINTTTPTDIILYAGLYQAIKARAVLCPDNIINTLQTACQKNSDCLDNFFDYFESIEAFYQCSKNQKANNISLIFASTQCWLQVVDHTLKKRDELLACKFLFLAAMQLSAIQTELHSLVGSLAVQLYCGLVFQIDFYYHQLQSSAYTKTCIFHFIKHIINEQIFFLDAFLHELFLCVCKDDNNSFFVKLKVLETLTQVTELLCYFQPNDDSHFDYTLLTKYRSLCIILHAAKDFSPSLTCSFFKVLSDTLLRYRQVEALCLSLEQAMLIVRQNPATLIPQTPYFLEKFTRALCQPRMLSTLVHNAQIVKSQLLTATELTHTEKQFLSPAELNIYNTKRQEINKKVKCKKNSINHITIPLSLNKNTLVELTQQGNLLILIFDNIDISNMMQAEQASALLFFTCQQAQQFYDSQIQFSAETLALSGISVAIRSFICKILVHNEFCKQNNDIDQLLSLTPKQLKQAFDLTKPFLEHLSTIMLLMEHQSGIINMLYIHGLSALRLAGLDNGNNKTYFYEISQRSWQYLEQHFKTGQLGRALENREYLLKLLDTALTNPSDTINNSNQNLPKTKKQKSVKNKSNKTPKNELSKKQVNRKKSIALAKTMPPTTKTPKAKQTSMIIKESKSLKKNHKSQMPQKNCMDLPLPVYTTLTTINHYHSSCKQSQQQALWFGGSVRNYYSYGDTRLSNDYDIRTYLTDEELASLFPNATPIKGNVKTYIQMVKDQEKHYIIELLPLSSCNLSAPDISLNALACQADGKLAGLSVSLNKIFADFSQKKIRLLKENNNDIHETDEINLLEKRIQANPELIFRLVKAFIETDGFAFDNTTYQAINNTKQSIRKLSHGVKYAFLIKCFTRGRARKAFSVFCEKLKLFEILFPAFDKEYTTLCISDQNISKKVNQILDEIDESVTKKTELFNQSQCVENMRKLYALMSIITFYNHIESSPCLDKDNLISEPLKHLAPYLPDESMDINKRNYHLAKLFIHIQELIPYFYAGKLKQGTVQFNPYANIYQPSSQVNSNFSAASSSFYPETREPLPPPPLSNHVPSYTTKESYSAPLLVTNVNLSTESTQVFVNMVK